MADVGDAPDDVSFVFNDYLKKKFVLDFSLYLI